MFPAQADVPIKDVPLSENRTCPHIFEQEDIDALSAAMAAERTLLLLGEPGVGKSQLARAAAWVLRRAFCHVVVDARTEARDLHWSEDMVARLADAQLVGVMADPDEAKKTRVDLALEKYIQPGPLWWAFHWTDAERQAKEAGGGSPYLHPDCSPDKGTVLLIDEIDKAEADVPNGLLEALGSRQFQPTGGITAVQAKRWPLIVVTSNDERRLPDAFVRRCIVHTLSLPAEEAPFVDRLVPVGRAHFPAADEALLREAAKVTHRDRGICDQQRLRPLPGQAEYLDLLRAVMTGPRPPDCTPSQWMNRISKYFLLKHASLQ
ncbi:AAA family ATPase [Rhodospirillum sp. A1_3_36]|uniref:AAA family ATPase n=1 Tax=Rhodospirillum sp. A1_3_36 TaxID=3391666 RepID=UPI0039A5EEE0